MRRRYTQLPWLGLLLVFLVLLIVISFQAFPQPAGKKGPNRNQDCSGNCFSAEVLSASPGANGCTEYEMRVSHIGTCRYELSHFVVDIPCGTVSNISNSGGYAQVFGKDPTTGVTGLKIDAIGNFGKTGPNFFTVKFSWCNSTACNSSDCWEPRVAFKAATCVDYDTARNTCQPPAGLRVTTQKQNVTCSGFSNGSLSVAVEGGEGPYTYSWSTGCTSPSIENLSAGTYTVTVTDSQGNVATVTEEVTAKSQIVLSGSALNPTCFGNANGSIDLTVAGGVAPYSYTWSNGSTTQDLANLTGGNYLVTVMDSIGCSNTAAFLLTNPFISVVAQTVRPSCTQANGQIDITVSGGAAPYTYLWSNGSTSQDVTGLATGNYSVTVTDANLCTSRTSYFLAENNTLHISFVVTPTSCVGGNTGAVNISVTGGTAPFSYLWQNGSTSEDLTGLPAGVQRVTVTDAGGCTANALMNVFKQTFQVPSQVVAPSCTGQADGSITLNPSGAPPFTYLWSTGATTNSISGLPSGLYSVTVTDATGCSQVLNYFISDPVINAFTTVTNPQCGAEGAFSIDLSVSGAIAPYSVVWSNGETTEDISGLNSGTYSVTITDANGCGKTVDVVVQPVVIGWSCSIAPPAHNPLCGSSGNSLSSSVAGATEYAWSVVSDDAQWLITSGQSSAAITFTAGGNGSSATFTLSITKDGCTQTCSRTLAGCSPVMTCGVDSASGAVQPIPSTPTFSTQSEPLKVKTASSASGFRLIAYPNPVVDKLSIDWTAETSEYVRLELIDLYGKRVAELYAGHVLEGETYRLDWNASHLNERLYFYRYSSGTRTMVGKVFKSY